MTVEKLIADLNQHLASRNLRETAEEQEVKYKKLLLNDLVDSGIETPEGHFVYEFGGEGLPLADGRYVRSVKREKRQSTTLDPDAVDKLLPVEVHEHVFRKNVTVSGLSDDMHEALMSALKDIGLASAAETEDVIDEDELLGLNYENIVSDEDLKGMYTEGKVVYALKVNYAKS